ncbi:tRNA (adenosine(37)-N6)-dimethylallyltransferase MiaA [Candidatus Parcubacteria bacterium]|nr:tRNA (adenosine(37)-N6)-dimethylallyltransferase MiaA [Candidatus Parcubacteria bacterium]
MSNLIVILGPTASGKTDLAIKLAKQFNGEIVSADSRQIYQGMDIGTAKPSKKQLSQVPHHLIDIIKPNKAFNAAVYKKMAVKAIKDIQKRGKVPFLVGGTGLYIQAVVDNLSFLQASANKRLRNNLEKETTKKLFDIYKKLDPKGSKLIDKENKRRLIRAIEVCVVTKKPYWEQRKQGSPLFKALQIGISLSEETLKKNNEARVKKMFRFGLSDEAESLAENYGWEISAMRTIGYQEWLSYFKGEIKKQEVMEDIKTHTLQFANRQMTWFKRDKRIIWNKNYQEVKALIKDFL